MNICRPHGVHECPKCWPGKWHEGLEGAIHRLRSWLDAKPNVRFDARDRAALTYLLAKGLK